MNIVTLTLIGKGNVLSMQENQDFLCVGLLRTFLDVPMLDVRESIKNCDEFLMRNEDGLPLRVVGGDDDIIGTLKIDPFLNILDVNGDFRCWGGEMSFHLHMVGLD